MQQLNPSEISELIRSKIQNLALPADVRTQGTVVTVTDGICRVHGLSDVMQGEMLEFPKNTFGLALNLERDSVGAVILGEYEHITEGDAVKCTGRILEVPVGPELLGRVVNSLGQLPEIHAQFVRLKNEHDGVVEAEIRTAFPLDNKQLAGLVADLERRFKHRVQPRVSQDKELIGGVRILVGDSIIDGSVRGKLEGMAAALKG